MHAEPAAPAQLNPGRMLGNHVVAALARIRVDGDYFFATTESSEAAAFPLMMYAALPSKSF